MIKKNVLIMIMLLINIVYINGEKIENIKMYLSEDKIEELATCLYKEKIYIGYKLKNEKIKVIEYDINKKKLKNIGVASKKGCCISLYAYNNKVYIGYKDEEIAKRIMIRKYDGKKWKDMKAVGFEENNYSIINTNDAILTGYRDEIYISFYSIDVTYNMNIFVMRYLKHKNMWEKVGNIILCGRTGEVKLLISQTGDKYLAFGHGGNEEKITVLEFLDKKNIWEPIGESLSDNEPDEIVMAEENNILYLGYVNTNNQKIYLIEGKEEMWNEVAMIGNKDLHGKDINIYVINEKIYLSYIDIGYIVPEKNKIKLVKISKNKIKFLSNVLNNAKAEVMKMVGVRDKLYIIYIDKYDNKKVKLITINLK